MTAKELVKKVRVTGFEATDGNGVILMKYKGIDGTLVQSRNGRIMVDSAVFWVTSVLQRCGA